MVERVTKNKVNWQRKTYPLKLKVTNEQKEQLDSFLQEYSKVTNFIIKKCVNEIIPTFKYHKTPENKENPTGKCLLCNKQKKLKYTWKTPNGKKQKNCGCLIGHYSLRKIFLPSKNYKLKNNNSTPDYDMRFAGKLYPNYPKMILGGDNLNGEKEYNRGLYDSCLQKATETIKSQNELNKKIDNDINWLSSRQTIIKRLLNNNTSSISKKDSEFYEKYDKKKLRKFLNKNNQKLKRLQNKKATEVKFKGNMSRIYNKYYDWVKENNHYKFSLKIFKKPMILDFFGKNYQKQMAPDFVEQKNQPEIELLKRGENYFIQYIYKKAIKPSIPDDTFTAVGVDLGILNHWTIACLNKESKKPFNIKFFNGRPMRRRRRQYYKIRRIWGKKTRQKDKGGKGKSKESGWLQKKFSSQNEKQYIKTELHKVTTELVQFVYGSVKKPVIVLEDLKNIRDETKKLKRSYKSFINKNFKGSHKKYAKHSFILNKELNNWNFKDMFDWIKYKAEWLGIPVVVVPAKNTSIECNKCGYVDENNCVDLHQLRFVCQECGYGVNIDFNASVNLAKSFFFEEFLE